MDEGLATRPVTRTELEEGTLVKRRMRALTAATVAVTLALTGACGSSTSKNATTASKPQFNAALNSVFNPSSKKGGTVTMAITQDWDSVDPGDTYYALSWNLVRLYGRSLVMFDPAPGPDGNKLIPDLATSLGQSSNGGMTWTYHIRPGVKFSDGTEITSADVKYAVLRSLDKTVLVNGPTYFNDWLNLPKGYQGPYKNPTTNTDQAISTPDKSTIVFHLNRPLGEFDYLAMLPSTIPVPQAKDDGAKYKNHVIASGPYMFQNYNPGKGFTLVRNPYWNPATDPDRKALPNQYNVRLGIDANDLDNQLISGTIQVDLAGTGVQTATLPRVLGNVGLKQRADNPTAARLWYVSILPTVKPFDNIACRQAVMYAADKTGYQAAYGGPLAGGQIATSIEPPILPGFQPTNVYPSGPDNKGDLAKAKAALAQCGKPNGFSTNIAYRSDRPKEQAVAESLQESLARVGIKLTLKGYPTSDYFSTDVGRPAFDVQNNIGLATNGWGADWNDGFGFLQQITDGRVIRPSGGSSNLSVNFPAINTMIDHALVETDPATRNADWAAIDKAVMEQAVMLPGIWAKAVTLRGEGLTNIFVNQAFGMYDYLAFGAQQ
jgi:peptide/nickel transport system substrate-binding protein